MARFDAEVRQPVPTIIGLILVGAAIAATVWLVRDLGPRSFPDDHGLTATSPEWLRCAAESIERHPVPFTTGAFRITATDHRSAVVEGTFRTIDVTLVEGRLSYWWGWGSRALWLDCPEVGLVSAEQRRQEAEVAAAARPCSERYGIRVMAEQDSVFIEVSADDATIERCGYREALSIRLVDDSGQEVMAWSGWDSKTGSETEWLISNWCHNRPAWVHLAWQRGKTSEPFGPSPTCNNPAAPPAVSATS